MVESVVEQIEVGSPEFFYPSGVLGVRRGRKKLLNREMYLDAVRRLGTDSPSILCKHFGVERTTVWRVRKKEVSDDEVEAILFELANMSLKPYQLSMKGFMQIPIIKQFIDLNVRNEASKDDINRKVRSLLNICRYLNVHPSKLTIEDCADLRAPGRC